MFHMPILCTWDIDGDNYLELLRTDKVYLIQSRLLVFNGSPDELCKQVETRRLAELPETKVKGLRAGADVLALIDRVVAEHVANQHRLIAGLPPELRPHLDAALRAWLASFEEGAG